MFYAEDTLEASAKTFFEHIKKLNHYESTEETKIGYHFSSITANESLNEPFCVEDDNKSIIKLKCGKSAVV